MVELNKIYLADCYEFIKQIPDKSIDCIYTDIPYLFNFGGSSLSGSRVSQSIGKMKNQIKDIINGIPNGTK